MNENRTEIKYNQIIGYRKSDNTFYMLDYTFKQSKRFFGATGTSFEGLNKREVIDRIEDTNDYVKDFWGQSASQGDFTGSLADFEDEYLTENNINIKELKEENIVENNFTGQDDSYRTELKDEDIIFIRESYEKENDEKIWGIDCTGGGRCFSNEMFTDLDDWILTSTGRELINAIIEAETIEYKDFKKLVKDNPTKFRVLDELKEFCYNTDEKRWEVLDCKDRVVKYYKTKKQLDNVIMCKSLYF